MVLAPYSDHPKMHSMVVIVLSQYEITQSHALVQFRAEKITSLADFSEIHPNLKKKLQRLSSVSSPEGMGEVISCPALELLFQQIVQVGSRIYLVFKGCFFTSCTRVCS